MDLKQLQRARLSVSRIRRSQAGTSAWDLHEIDSTTSIRSVRQRPSLSHTHVSRWHASDSACFPNYDPEEDVQKAKNMRKKQKSVSFCALFRYARCLDKFLMIIGAVVALISGILVPWIFYWCGKLLYVILLDVKCYNDSKLEGEHSKFLNGIAFEFLINIVYAAAAFCLSNYISWRCFAWPADIQTKRLSVLYFESVIRKDMAWFDNYVDRDFAHLMMEEITQIRAGIGEKVPALIHQISASVCVIVMTFMLSYKLGILLIGCAPIIYILALSASYADSRQEKEAAKSYVHAGNLAEESLSNIKIVKIYQGEVTEVGRFLKYLEPMSRAEFKWILVASLCSALVWFLFNCLLSGAVWLSAFGIHVNGCDKSQLQTQYDIALGHTYFISLELDYPKDPQIFVMVLMAFIFTSSHAMDIPFYIKDILEAKQIASEVYFLIDWKPRIDNLSEDGRVPNSNAIGRIGLHNVGFKYPSKPGEWIMRSISLTIYPRQIIGLCGRERSGKSTLLKLILRLYDTCEGHVTLDGINIQAYNVRWLRSQIYLVTQDTIVFPVSIEENLRFVNTNASMSDIQDACRGADIHLRIMELPQGYQTVMAGGHRSKILTPKEMRKISIARAILFKPKILLIDDPLLSNDDEFESILMNMINRFQMQSTIILTASRANFLMKRCDHIFYFEKGRIVETGTHMELLKEKGPYYLMIEETLDAIFESKPTFTSQLTSYKFAKSLRKKREQKQNKARKSGTMAKTTESIENVKNMFNHEQDSEHNPEHRGFGVGGFQKYSFAKSESFNPERIGNLLRKIKANAKHSKRDVTVKKRSRHRKLRVSNRPKKKTVTSSITSLDERDKPYTGEMMNTSSSLESSIMSTSDTQEHHVKISDVGSGGVHLTPSRSVQSRFIDKSVISGVPYNTDYNVDNVSICSEDAEEFWDDYCNKLEELKHLHEHASWWDMLSLVKGDCLWIAGGCLASIILGTGIPCYGLLIGLTCLNIAEENDKTRLNTLMWLCFAFVAVGLITGVSAFCQEMFFSMAGKRFCVRIRRLLFESMLKQDLAWFDLTENDISVLNVRLSTDTDCVQHVLLTTYGVLFQNAATVIISTTISFVMFPSHYQVTLGVLGGALIMIILGYFTGILVNNLVPKMDEKLEMSSQLSYQTISSIRSCVVLGLEKYFLIKFKESLAKPFRHFYFKSELRCICSGVSRGFSWLIIAVFIYFTVRFANQAKQHPDIEYLFIVAELMIFGLKQIGEVLSLLTSPKIGKQAAHRIWKILLSESKLNHSSKIIKFDEKSQPPRIQLIDVHFHYPDREVLRGISMDIMPTSLIAIVGATESGKTSLTNIILRLTDPSFGALLFNGKDARDINVGCIRKIMAFLEQDSGIINDMSVADNIRFGDNSRVIDINDVIGVAKTAQIHTEIVSMKHGYDTKVNSLESGMFTYAFKQRLALARALISNPKILIIDEVNTSIDSEHDIMVRNAIKNASIGRTVIMVSQKIEPIRHADMIYVMNYGVVVESGKDSSLLDLQGVYYEMYMTQRLVEAAAELRPDKKTSLEDSETIEILKRQAQNAQAKRKSSIAYTKFLSQEMERMREHLKMKDRQMKEISKADEKET